MNSNLVNIDCWKITINSNIFNVSAKNAVFMADYKINNKVGPDIEPNYLESQLYNEGIVLFI